ncbi:transposase [Candidatus Pacearchaeota archaeon]|nr:transposase [Candidatus Pacearchaeota archaeon]
MNRLIDWEKFLTFFPERKSLVGRPNYEKILMIKLSFLQGWYGLSDEELEFQINDRLSFQQFLGFPKNIPDYSTIWRFREELSECDITDNIWDELQRQIKEKHITVEKGCIQDASFIIADPGKTSSGMDERGQAAKTSRNRDGSWTKKERKVFLATKCIRKQNVVLRLLKLLPSRRQKFRIMRLT